MESRDELGRALPDDAIDVDVVIELPDEARSRGSEEDEIDVELEEVELLPPPLPIPRMPPRP